MRYLFILLFVFGCGAPVDNMVDDDGEGGTATGKGRKEEVSDVSFAVADYDKLPECTETRKGQVVYIVNDDLFNHCMDLAWSEVSIEGDKGLKGDKGDTGIAGIAGTNGVDGANGSNGSNGSNGTNGTNGVDGFSLKIKNNSGTVLGYIIDVAGSIGQRKFKMIMPSGYVTIVDLANNTFDYPAELSDKVGCMYGETACSGSCYSRYASTSDHTGIPVKGTSGWYIGSGNAVNIDFNSYYNSSGTCITTNFNADGKLASYTSSFNDTPFTMGE